MSTGGPSRTPDDGLEAELDALYGAPPAEFVAQRDALTKRLKATGATAEAARVKALRKPTAAAWAINRLQLERRGLEPVTAAGETLRKALRGAASAHARRAAMEARRRAIEAAVAAAAALLAETGRAESPALLRRIERTILALAAGTPGPDAPRAGRLDQELEPPGFEAVAELALGSAAAPSPPAEAQPTSSPRAKPSQARAPTPAPSPANTGKSPGAAVESAAAPRRDPLHERALRDAQSALDGAEDDLERSTTEVERARARVAQAESALQEARADVDAARGRLAAARARRDALRRELDRVRQQKPSA